jgi:hypothetical protein
MLKDSKFGVLWAPITIQYPEFVFKRFVLRDMKWNKKTKCSITENDIIEPLSEMESKFLQDFSKKNNKKLPFISGKCFYNNFILQDPISKSRKQKKICVVSGISGHTMFLLELARLFNLDWKFMYFAMILTLVPIHHSISEINDAVEAMNLTKRNNIFKIFPTNKKFVSKTKKNSKKKLNGTKRKKI